MFILKYRVSQQVLDENLKAAQNKNLDIAVKNFVELKGDLQSALLSHKVKKAFTNFSSIVNIFCRILMKILLGHLVDTEICIILCFPFSEIV
mgnify:CR=1 FL=1